MKFLLLQPEQQQSTASAHEDFSPNLPPSVAAALEKYRPVFSVPEGMPPKRPFDHGVHLLPGTNPVNVRSYRYPYFQKTEIERQVREMFD